MRVSPIYWRLIILLLCGMLLSALGQAQVLPGAFSNELDTDHYDCTLALATAAALSPRGSAQLVLEWADANSPAVWITIDHKQLTLATGAGSPAHLIVQLPASVTPGADYQIIVLRRGTMIGLMQNGELLYRGVAPRGAGINAAATAEHGWTVKTADTRIQRIEAVTFADDFMRKADEPGAWRMAKAQQKNWMLSSAWDAIPHGNRYRFSSSNFAQNPFSWVGRSADGTVPALCTTGETFWEDYTLTVNIRPAAEGAVGVAVNMPDDSSGIFVRWSPVNDHSARGNKLILYRVSNGKTLSVLDSSAGGYLPGQWYKLSVVSTLQGVQVFIDGAPRGQAAKVTPWRGGIGLYVEGKNGATFDHVTVYGQALNADLLLETQQSHIPQRFEIDKQGMKGWANSQSDWDAADKLPNQFWYRRDVSGDHAWLTVTVTPSKVGAGELDFLLNSDGKDPAHGYRAVVKQEEPTGPLLFSLYHDATLLAVKPGKALEANVEYTFHFWRVGTHLWLEEDDDTVIEATDAKPPAGLRPGYRADGAFASVANQVGDYQSGVRDVMVFSHNVLDYSFAAAPADWLTWGTWMPTIRWSCQPQWSFLGGWSRGEAAMWHKARFSGDHSFEAFLGVKMEYPREHESYANRYRDFCITICGDGNNVRSGYSGIFATPINRDTKQIQILRNGVMVASQNIPPQLAPNAGTNHRSWFDLELTKHGAVIDFSVKWYVPYGNGNGEVKGLSLSYTDPAPLDGGAPAIWTEDNGIMVARTRIFFSTPPALRQDPMVTIDDPWYPEWANLRQPITLDFADSGATSGKPVHLLITPKAVPVGGEGDAQAEGTHVSFTPKINNPYWFQIAATDGQSVSPKFNVDLPVFDPTLGRDDSHALLLYRFGEGKDNVVHDLSPFAPKVDLLIGADAANASKPTDPTPPDLSARWAPQQGLLFLPTSRVMSKIPADKLLAISKTNTFTIECWVSIDTVYSATDANGFFSWDNPLTADGSKRNLSMALGSGNSLILTPMGGAPVSAGSRAYILRTGLQHLVITWDGVTTRVYLNGKKAQEFAQQAAIAWKPSQMLTGSSFILGNSAGMANPFAGTFYLLAIHDRCFSDTDILRHYNAGPSAK